MARPRRPQRYKDEGPMLPAQRKDRHVQEPLGWEREQGPMWRYLICRVRWCNRRMVGSHWLCDNHARLFAENAAEVERVCEQLQQW